MTPPNLEYVLRTPPWAISLMSVASVAFTLSTPLPRTIGWGASVGQPSWLTAAYLFFALLWPYALYDASRSRTRRESRDRHGYKIFVAGSIATSIVLPLSACLYYAEGQPQQIFAPLIAALTIATSVLSLASIGYAANAMHKAEIELGHQPEWHPLISVFFMPIGIWFIYRPIQRLLAASRVPTS